MKTNSKRLILATTALAPAIWGTTYVATTELLPAGYPLHVAMLRALPAGLLLLLVFRTLPRGHWWWRVTILGAIVPLMTNIRSFWVVTSTGSPWWVVHLYMGNPVKRILKRGVAAFCAKGVDFRMFAIHDMDRATDEKRRNFLTRIKAAFASL